MFNCFNFMTAASSRRQYKSSTG